jgi:hypothetical protein
MKAKQAQITMEDKTLKNVLVHIEMLKPILLQKYPQERF